MRGDPLLDVRLRSEALVRACPAVTSANIAPQRAPASLGFAGGLGI